MEEKILKLKEIEKAYRLAIDWYYAENATEEQYNDNIGEYKDFEPYEIAEDMCELIREL